MSAVAESMKEQVDQEDLIDVARVSTDHADYYP